MANEENNNSTLPKQIETQMEHNRQRMAGIASEMRELLLNSATSAPAAPTTDNEVIRIQNQACDAHRQLGDLLDRFHTLHVINRTLKPWTLDI